MTTKILLMAMGGFILAPMVISSILGLTATGMLAGTTAMVSSTFQNSIDAQDPLDGKIKVTNATFGSHNTLKSEYRAIANFDKFDASRTVSFEIRVPGAEIFTAARPFDRKDKAGNEITAKSWAQDYAARECSVIMEKLASACEISRVSTTLHDDRYVGISVTAKYIQKTELGKLSGDHIHTVQRITIPLDKSWRRSDFSWKTAEKKRKSIYAKAIKRCEKTKSQEGNCAVNEIKIHVIGKSRSLKFGLSGQTGFSYLHQGAKKTPQKADG